MGAAHGRTGHSEVRVCRCMCVCVFVCIICRHACVLVIPRCVCVTGGITELKERTEDCVCACMCVCVCDHHVYCTHNCTPRTARRISPAT